MKKMMKKIFIFSLPIFYLNKIGLCVGSGGFANQVPSARTMSRANSVVASIDDASAISFNPARLTTIRGTDLLLGGTFQKISTDYDNQAGTTDSMVDNTAFTPNFHIASNMNLERFSFGLGINIPHGIATEWGQNSPLRYIATKTDLSIMDVNPAMAYKINDQFSIGIGLDYYNVTTVESQKKINTSLVNTVLGSPDTAPDSNFKLEGDGDSLGYGFGVSYVPQDQHLVGLAFRSGANIEVDGTLELNGLSGASAAVFGTDYKTDAKAKIYVPQEIQLGYAYKYSGNLTIELDAQWDKWSVFKDQNVTISETDPTRLALLQGGNPIPKNWENAWSAGLGVEYKLNEKFDLRGGYGFFDSPVPNSTFEASTPDSDLHMITFGVGYNVNSFRADLGMQLFRLNERYINNNVGQSDGTTGNGTYDAHAEYYGFDFGYRFGAIE